MHNHLIIFFIILSFATVFAEEASDILQSRVSFQKGVVLEGWEKKFQPKSEEKKPVVERKQIKKTLPSPQKSPIVRKKLAPVVKKKDSEIVVVPEVKVEVKVTVKEPKIEPKPVRRDDTAVRLEKKPDSPPQTSDRKKDSKQHKNKDGKKNQKSRLKELKKRQRRDSFKNRKID